MPPGPGGGITQTMASSFEAYRRNLLAFPTLGFALDLSRAELPAATAARLAPAMARAFADMAALEQGAVANPDEKRMVGHYWLRTPELAPDPAIGAAVRARPGLGQRGKNQSCCLFLKIWMPHAVLVGFACDASAVFVSDTGGS